MSTVFDLSPPPNSPQAQPPYKAPPVTVILTVVLLVFFFAGFFSIYLCRYLMGNMNNSSNSRGTQSGNAAQPTGSASNGLNPSIIATFPTLVYSSVKDLRQDKNDVECAVCLLEFQDNDELRLLTVCNHVFHSECIDLWFGNHTTCPLCRRSLLPPENNVADPPPDPPPENNNQQENETREDNNSVSTKDDEEEVVVVVVEGGDSHEEGTTSGAMASQDGGQQHGEDVVERFSRCHSTGHSIIHVEPDDHRYTLRLPDRLYVKDHIAMGHNWTRSCTTFGEFYGNSSSRKASGLAEFSGFSGINVTRV